MCVGMNEIVQEKMKSHNEKYLVEKDKDSAKKYNELQCVERTPSQERWGFVVPNMEVVDGFKVI